MASVAADVFAGRLPSGIAMSEVAGWAADLAAATEPDVQRRLVGEMLARLSSMEARYVVQLIVGELDIGLEPADVDGARGRARRELRGRAPPRPPTHSATRLTLAPEHCFRSVM